MGMGHFANSVEEVSEELVKKTCPDEFKAFMDLVEANDLDMSEVAQAVMDGGSGLIDIDDEGLIDKVEDLVTKLCDQFESVTGLELYLQYHNPDEGDRYDDLEGVYWSLGAVFQYTDAAKKFIENNGEGSIITSNFVTFG
jgi:hypothetical protein